jgi:hypothetical protein
MVRTLLRPVFASTCIAFAFLSLLASSSAFGQSTNPFLTPPTFPGSGQSISADVNGDGKPDLLFLDGTVLLGKGDGSFTTGTPWRSAAPQNPIPNQFAIADFNGDGRQDILIAGPLNTLSVLLGNGDGTFQAPVTTPISTPATALCVGDLNGDGKADVLTQESGGNFVYLGTSSGRLTPGITSHAVSALGSFADFNGDGKLDLFAVDSGVQLGNGDGTFQALLPLPAFSDIILGNELILGDFNGDGILDVFAFGGTVTKSLEFVVLFGNGDGTFHAAPTQSLSTGAGDEFAVAVDLNGDGKDDIVGSTGLAVQVLTSNGDGTFKLGEYFNAPIGVGTGATNMVVADFNGDKKKDVAAFNTMLLSNGDGTLQGNPAIPGQFGLFNAIGDFNGDAHPDIASVGQVEQTGTNPNQSPTYAIDLNVWLNDGKNNFTLTHTYLIDIPSPEIDILGLVVFGTTADLNNDGKLDLVGYRADGSGLSMLVLLGNGDGSFGAPIATSVPFVSGDRLLEVAFTLADLNGDGKLDLLVNAGNGPNPSTLSIFLGKGDGSFGPASNPFTGGTGGTIVAGDFNNDKKTDVITGTENGLGVLLGNGDGTFQPTTFITNASCGTGCGDPVSGDFNGDGNLDLMVASIGGYQVLLGKGDGTFTNSPAVTESAGLFSAVQVVDFNGDGNLDALGFVGSSNSLSLILGNGDGTFGAPLPITYAGAPFVADFNGDKQPDILEVGANQLVFLLNDTGPGFALSAGLGGSATVAAGKSASYSLSLGGTGGFSGPVSLKCSGAPTGATCTVTPSSVTLSGTARQSAVVSVTTAAASQLLPTAFSDPGNPARRIVWIFGLMIIAGIAAALAVARVSRRRFAYVVTAAFCALMLVSASLMAGCGTSNANSGSSGSGSGAGGAAGGTATGTYTITVTASSQSPAVTRTTKLTLIVQ